MILQLFKEQVLAARSNTAICAGDRRMSYGELDSLSDKVCWFLTASGLQEGDIVAVIGDRSWEFVATIFGVIKSGCIYLPIESNTPVKRVDHMLRESDCKIVIAVDPAVDIPAGGIAISAIWEMRSGTVEYREHPNVYVMYTSGSTGLPKGVIIKQKGIVRLVRASGFVQLDTGTRMFLTGAISFDASTFEIFGSLLNGGILYIEDIRLLFNTDAFRDFIVRNQINTMWLSSPIFNQLVDTNEHLFSGSAIRYLIVGGDILSPPHINKVLRNAGNIKIINGYGPTENTTFSTTFELSAPVDGPIVPIGKAIGRSEAYVLNERLELSGINEDGEIYVGGDGLMEGYLKDERLTGERMIGNPFCPGTKLYKTGDRGYWDKDRVMYCTGRADSQLKINGYRIERNEIRFRVLESGFARDTFIHYFKDTGLLAAYLIPTADYNEQELIEYLTSSLPEYMIPHHLVLLDRFPLNNNGKIDAGRLPKPGLKASVNAGNEKMEQELFHAWTVLLKRNIDGTNLTDSFFDLGGNSIKLFKLLYETERISGVKIEPGAFFRQPTLAFVLEQIREGKGVGSIHIPSAASAESYKPSAAQKRLYFLQQLNRQSTSYNITWVYKLGGNISNARIKSIFRELVSIHEPLRTRLVIKEGELVQVIVPDPVIPVEEKAVPANGVSQAIAEFVRPFDLAEGAIRLGLFDVENGEKLLLVDVHHCMFDGLSLKIVIEDFAKLLSGGKAETARINYKDYAEWQSGPEYVRMKERQKEFWTSLFKDQELPALQLVPDKARPRVFSGAGRSVDFQFDRSLTERLKVVVADNGVTNFMLLYTLFNILLYKLTGNEDVIIGVPVSGRSNPALERVAGLFANTLAFRVGLDRQRSFADHLAKCREFCTTAFNHQDYPLEELITSLRIDRDISRNPLFETMFAYNDFDTADIAEPEDAADRIIAFPFKRKTTNFDVCLIAVESKGLFRFSLQYYSEIFEEETIVAFANIFTSIAEAVSYNPAISLQDIPLKRDGTIADLFRKQVSDTPDARALVFNDLEITYLELYEQSLSFAETLLAKGVTPGSVVAIRAQRGPDMISSMFGVLFAGCCYLPMDPFLPRARALKILSASGASAIILSGDDEIAGSCDNTLFFEGVSGRPKSGFVPFMPVADDLAYIIYTSGSTGDPKGVAIRHRSIVNTLQWRVDYYKFNAQDVTLQIPAYYFDSSVEDIFTTLISGGTLVLTPAEIFRDLEGMAGLCKSKGVTNLLLVPSFYNELLYRLGDVAGLRLRFITVAGENINENLVKRHFDILPAVDLYNEYGPTECSVCATVHKFSPGDTRISIGAPISGIQCLVLNKEGNDCPDGIPGELYLTGIGLASGYYHNPELTDSVFIPAVHGGGRMYKTGDLVRKRINGGLDFLGRKDHQVKIRGFRIEPGEIEFFMAKCDGVTEAIVIKDPSLDILSSYFTAERRIAPDEIARSLKEHLPLFMVPARIIQVDAFPRTATGKIDRSALARIPVTATPNKAMRPLSALETQLLSIWRKIVRSESVGATDNFFESGGNSINILSFQNGIQKEIGVAISVDRFFQYADIGSLAAFMEGKTFLSQEEKTADFADLINLFDENA